MPDAAWAVSGHPPRWSRKMGQPPVLTSSKQLSTLHRRFTCVRLSQPCLPESCFGFSATLTTMAFDHSSLRWLEINTWLSTSKGPPSSLVELRIAVWTGVTRDTRPISAMGVTTLPLLRGMLQFSPKGEDNHEAAGIHRAGWQRSSGLAAHCVRSASTLRRRSSTTKCRFGRRFRSRY